MNVHKITKTKKPKVALVFGTRPEIVKCTPVIRECVKRSLECVVIHTGQHYSPEMDAIFFEELALPAPAHNLHIGSGTHGAQTGKMLEAIEAVLISEQPDFVLVQGDTNSALAGALAGVKLQIPVGHIEAGLRSYFRKMPEEINRVLIDHMADFLFVPTPASRAILKGEGISGKKVIVTGNTVVDAVFQESVRSRKKSSVNKKLGLSSGGYFLVTAHRPESVDNKEQCAFLVETVRAIARKYAIPVVWPVHPRTRSRLVEFGFLAGLEAEEYVVLQEPVGFWDFIALEADARLIITDSGGIQEEACILGVPCVTLRDNTERPETVSVGANILAGLSSAKVLRSVTRMLQKKKNWKNPFGSGDASKKIIDALVLAHRNHVG